MFERKTKEKLPVVAICYDFDKTLSPDDMQAQGYIQSVYDGDVKAFWEECGALAEANEMDSNLAYMYKMVDEAQGRVVFTKKKLEEYGAKVALFPGVEKWFERIDAFGNERGVIVEHYIISSGLKEMIEGTSIAKAGVFEKIYASSFMYNKKGVAIWPAQAINYTNKTQFLFRIEKGTLNINDPGVNESFGEAEIRVPFRNIIYIGDSDTDIPCMKLVTVNGGNAIAVYNPETKDKSKAYKMMREKRIKFFAPADYNEGTELDLLVKAIISKTAENEVLENLHYTQRKEQVANDKAQGEEKLERIGLIIDLDNSHSYATTHFVIGKLQAISGWESEEKEELFRIAVENSQVRGVLKDNDVKAFYQSIIKSSKILDSNAISVKRIIES